MKEKWMGTRVLKATWSRNEKGMSSCTFGVFLIMVAVNTKCSAQDEVRNFMGTLL